jgi:hypothetical protein
MKKALIIGIIIALLVVVGVILLIKFTKETQKPEVPDEEYCEQDADCACGVHVDTGECFYGNRKYVNTLQQCPDFCTGIDGTRSIKCIGNECKPVRK